MLFKVVTRHLRGHLETMAFLTSCDKGALRFLGLLHHYKLQCSIPSICFTSLLYTFHLLLFPPTTHLSRLVVADYWCRHCHRLATRTFAKYYTMHHAIDVGN